MNTKVLNIIDQIKSGKISKVVVLSGSGVSTITGIPDFRSKGGLYDTLKPDILTATTKQKRMLLNDPTMVVNYKLFKENQFPYLEVRKPFILGSFQKRWSPSISHFFFKILEDRGLLQRLYTQNIDGLDNLTGMSNELIVQLHGSITQISCEFCGAEYDKNKFISKLQMNIRNIYDPTDMSSPQISTHIHCENCGSAGIKPSTVMYGRKIPNSVYKNLNEDLASVNLLIVVGTSLSVSPACEFVNAVKPSVHRLVVNNEVVGENLGMQFNNKKSKDAILLGNSDESFLLFLNELGWINDLYKYTHLMCENSLKIYNDFVLNNKINEIAHCVENISI